MNVSQTFREDLKDFLYLELSGTISYQEGPRLSSGGSFCDLYRGQYQEDDGESIEVAIKMLRFHLQGVDMRRVIPSSVFFFSLACLLTSFISVDIEARDICLVQTGRRECS